MSQQAPRSLVRRKQQPVASISPSQREEKQVFNRSVFEEVLAKMERTVVNTDQPLMDSKGKPVIDSNGKPSTTKTPLSKSHSFARDAVLAITPSLGLGKKAGLIKENVFGLQDMAMLAALNELHNGPDDISVKGMLLVEQNTTLSMYPRAITEDLRNVNIIQKEDPEQKLFMKLMMQRELGLGANIAAGLEHKEETEET